MLDAAVATGRAVSGPDPRAAGTAHFLSDVMVGGFTVIVATRETLLLGFPALGAGLVLRPGKF